jgi:hypothetical protein
LTFIKDKTFCVVVIWERWKKMAKYEEKMLEELERYAKIKQMTGQRYQWK